MGLEPSQRAYYSQKPWCLKAYPETTAYHWGGELASDQKGLTCLDTCFVAIEVGLKVDPLNENTISKVNAEPIEQ